MSISDELRFNMLNKISLLYNNKTDGTDILGAETLFKSLTPEQVRHNCASYCYNNPDYEFCNFCPDASKNINNPKNVSSNKEPAYVKQFDKLTNEVSSDNIIYNNNDLIPYGQEIQQPTKSIIHNNREYKLYAPYIVIKGE